MLEVILKILKRRSPEWRAQRPPANKVCSDPGWVQPMQQKLKQRLTRLGEIPETTNWHRVFSYQGSGTESGPTDSTQDWKAIFHEDITQDPFGNVMKVPVSWKTRMTQLGIFSIGKCVVAGHKPYIHWWGTVVKEPSHLEFFTMDNLQRYEPINLSASLIF